MPSNDKQKLKYADSSSLFLVLQETEATTQKLVLGTQSSVWPLTARDVTIKINLCESFMLLITGSKSKRALPFPFFFRLYAQTNSSS